MRLFLSTIGTGGEIVPYALLAKEARRRGHEVTVHTWEHYRPWFPEEVPFVAAASQVTADAVDEMLMRLLRAPDIDTQLREFAGLAYGLGRGTEPARAQYKKAREAAEGHELALVHVMDHLAQAACEDAGVPWAAYSSRPLPPRAQADAAFGTLDAELGALVSVASGKPRTVQSYREPSKHRTLVACSPHLCGGGNFGVSLTGGWIEPPRIAALPPELETFLAAPGPVLFVTFGSFPDVDGRTERMVAAARTSQWRAIIQVLPQAPAPSSAADLYVLRTRVNFASLLARVTAVVHHGSSGTTHEVVRAGCPSLVVPQVAEQLFLGVQLALRQLAPPPLQLGERDPGLLAARFGELRNPRHATAVARVAPLVAAENGVARAASLLETTLATLRA